MRQFEESSPKRPLKVAGPDLIRKGKWGIIAFAVSHLILMLLLPHLGFMTSGEGEEFRASIEELVGLLIGVVAAYVTMRKVRPAAQDAVITDPSAKQDKKP